MPRCELRYTMWLPRDITNCAESKRHVYMLAGANGGDRTQFQMTASAAYRTATMHFKQAQTSMDPNNIGAVLAAHPFHIQCLLAMCDLYITTGQVRHASRITADFQLITCYSWRPQIPC